MRVDFDSLRPEKRRAILNAALDEFGGKGYAMASTNEIVRKAGISKGALFTYFPNKKALFLYLVDDAWSVIETQYLGAIPAVGDLIARLRAAVEVKMGLLAQYPHLFAFMARLLTERDGEVAGRLADFAEMAAEAQNRVLFSGLDDALYRRDIPKEQTARMLCWIMEGYTAELTARVRGVPLDELDLEGAVREFDVFLEQLRRIFYRTEEGQS